MMFLRICGFLFGSAASDVVVTVVAVVVVTVVAVDIAYDVAAVAVAAVVVVFASVVADVITVHVLHLHLVVGDAAHTAIVRGDGGTRSLGARENLQWSPESIAATAVLQQRIPTFSNNSAPFWREYVAAGCRWTDCLSCGTVVKDGW